VKSYNAPQLTAHGNVEAITQAFGSKTKDDKYFVGGSNVSGPSIAAQGSVDGIIVPKP
jgi:hypothetical protein